MYWIELYCKLGILIPLILGIISLVCLGFAIISNDLRIFAEQMAEKYSSIRKEK